MIADDNLSLPAPAKLNLFLHVTGQRPDGYHLLQTAFQLLDLCDQLSLRRTENSAISLCCTGTLADLPTEQNLIVRAARLLQAQTGSQQGASIDCDKRIPHGGGLGGGSSDAATTLLGLNALWKTGLSIDQLAALALQLGADVPVFVRGFSAWAEGVGDALSPLELAAQWYLIIDPGVSVPTAKIFSDEQLTRNTKPITLRAFLEQGGHNDCEAVAKRLFPEIGQAMLWLSQHGNTHLTGTGGCIFTAFKTRQEAELVAQQVPAKWHALIARGVNQSPLRQALEHRQ